MTNKPFSITVTDLVKRGSNDIPKELISLEHVIYNSPASLAFNSPGAEGFGVKRAGLAIPGSVMLLIGPGCCGRNTTILSEMSGYSDRFFFYTMDETDVVTGRHLTNIPAVCKEIYDSLDEKPSVIMICMTCVDALLGTDMERVCRKATEEAGLPVVPCYMYALTREGRKPPMVAVREAVYSLLEKKPKKSTSVNLLGFFSPLEDDSDLYELLSQIGVKTIREISRCQTFDEYLMMSEANFNLVLHPESRLAAQSLQERLGIPSIELTRLYQIDKIQKQYAIFAKALGSKFKDDAFYKEAESAVSSFVNTYGDKANFAIGEMMNANSFELALALSRYGLNVSEIYGTVTTESFIYLKELEKINPNIKVFSNLAPTMMYYEANPEINITIGKDAAYYQPQAAHVLWVRETQPFGYTGVTHLFNELSEAMKGVQ